MAKLDHTFQSHLSLHHLVLGPSAEWTPKLPCWALILVSGGNGFWLQTKENRDLTTGTALLLAPGVRGTFRASQLGELSMRYSLIEPNRLLGLLTLDEVRFLAEAANREEFSCQLFPPQCPLAASMQLLGAAPEKPRCRFRLQLLQLFLEIFETELVKLGGKAEANSGAQERLSEFLKQTPPSDLLHLRFSDLASRIRCTPRHLSRIFQEVVGMSFREKHADLRLSRACELLANTDAKVMFVALESGYPSLSLFNLVFKRRFGMSPGKWRNALRASRTRSLSSSVRPMEILSPRAPRLLNGLLVKR